MKNKLIKNTIINSAEVLLTHPINLLLIGYMISKLGAELYGIISFATIFSVVGYASLLDFGIQAGVIVFIAEYLAKGDFVSVNRLVNSSLLLFTVIGVFLFAAVFMVSSSDLINFIKYEEQYSKLLQGFILLAGAQLFVQFPVLVLSATFEGYQKYDLLKGVSFYYKLVTYLLIFLVVFFEYNIIYIAWVNLFTALIHLIVLFFTLRKLPGIKFDLRYIELGEIIKVFGYGKKLFLFRLSGLLYYPTDRILISVFLGLSFLTVYEVIIRFSQVIRAFLLFLYSAVIPASAELNSQHDKERLVKLFWAGTRYSIILSFGLLTPVVVFAKPLVILWVGQEYLYLILSIQIYSMHLIISSIPGFGITMLLGIKKIHRLMYLYVGAAILNLAVSMALLSRYGVYGLLAGTVAGYIVPFIPYLFVFNKEFGISFNDMYQDIFKKVFIYGFGFFIMINLFTFLPENHLFDEGIKSVLIGIGFVFVAYFICTWFFMFTKGDRLLIRGMFSRCRTILGKYVTNNDRMPT